MEKKERTVTRVSDGKKVTKTEAEEAVKKTVKKAAEADE